MNINDYILEQGFIIIPFLYISGQMIKGIDKIADKYIPFILLVFGIGFANALLGFSAESIIQGVLLTGVTVYGNQAVKQLNKDY